jgi:predicted metallopeptidase
MAQGYEPAPQEVVELANDLIYEHHSHLGPIRIEYLFVSEPIVERGKEVWGRAAKVTGRNAYLAARERPQEAIEPRGFFVIELVKKVWELLDKKAKTALLDHELEHCWVKDDGSLVIVPHDLEEFNNIVRRHGLWRVDIETFLAAAEGQRRLFTPVADSRDGSSREANA